MKENPCSNKFTFSSVPAGRINMFHQAYNIEGNGAPDYVIQEYEATTQNSGHQLHTLSQNCFIKLNTHTYMNYQSLKVRLQNDMWSISGKH